VLANVYTEVMPYVNTVMVALVQAYVVTNFATFVVAVVVALV
jgi:hypothetical protein